MDQLHRLNEDEIADALSGKLAEERIAECPTCAEEFADWKDLGGRLRQDLASRADLPAYFWMRQQARIRERLAPGATRLGWAAVAICALVLLAFGMVQRGVAPRAELAQTAPEVSANQVAQVDPDDALLQDIHASLQRELPAPLAPAVVLVEEMASASNQAQQVKEN
jgi:anti-sigma factor RsiW